jgi:hypothetical protein
MTIKNVSGLTSSFSHSNPGILAISLPMNAQ